MIQEFSLVGLNRKQNTGVYATIEMDNEDWFHAHFDESLWPVDNQYSLFNYMDNEDFRFKGAKAVVKFDGWSTGNVPINPIVTEIKNLP